MKTGIVCKKVELGNPVTLEKRFAKAYYFQSSRHLAVGGELEACDNPDSVFRYYPVVGIKKANCGYDANELRLIADKLDKLNKV